MIRSMTAYACNEASYGDSTINCELRSVNHRYSDITIKLPDQLRFIEADLRS
ncbi:MAG TPA: YicC/YloC family endoribonuclease, partial [Methylomicrobium sp.]|nr:YicC/YloC family endoribonuclease [Methylomicrobium sp.]